MTRLKMLEIPTSLSQWEVSEAWEVTEVRVELSRLTINRRSIIKSTRYRGIIAYSLINTKSSHNCRQYYVVGVM